MSSALLDLSGKVAAVTGGAMGIGFGIVERLSGAGADVLLVDLDGNLAAAKAGQCDGPGRVAPLQADVSAAEAGDRIVAECIERFGSLDILVNNAGIFPMTPMLDLSRDLWQRIVDVNLTGLAFVSQAVGRRMVDQGTGGKIVNIASIDALHPSMVGLAAYDASKGGVLMFTRSFALEMAPHGVTVNAIAPGGITTEGTAAPLAGSGMTQEQMAAMTEQFAAAIPLRRMGVPDDIAKVALFLASPAADYITGEMIVVDGGALIA